MSTDANSGTPGLAVVSRGVVEGVTALASISKVVACVSLPVKRPLWFEDGRAPPLERGFVPELVRLSERIPLRQIRVRCCRRTAPCGRTSCEFKRVDAHRAGASDVSNPRALRLSSRSATRRSTKCEIFDDYRRSFGPRIRLVRTAHVVVRMPSCGDGKLFGVWE